MLAHGIYTAQSSCRCMLYDRRHTFESADLRCIATTCPETTVPASSRSRRALPSDCPCPTARGGEYLILLGHIGDQLEVGHMGRDGTLIVSAAISYGLISESSLRVHKKEPRRCRTASWRERGILSAWPVITLWRGIGPAVFQPAAPPPATETIRQEMCRWRYMRRTRLSPSDGAGQKFL